jgi:phosphoglycerate dehydrogenase-like enzyme
LRSEGFGYQRTLSIHRSRSAHPSDETALIKLLKEKAIAGAALDVFTEEPLAPNSPLLRFDKVVLTPHIGWPTDSGFEGFADNAVENMLSYMEGKRLNGAEFDLRNFEDKIG